MAFRFLPVLTLPALTLVLCLPGFTIHAAEAVDDVSVGSLLDKMSQAVHGSNYTGVFVYRHNRRIDTMRVIHRKDAEGERERLVSLTGVPREVIRVGNDVSCFLPDKRSVLVGHSHRRKPFPIALTHNPERLKPYYDFVLLGKDRTADRNARIIDVRPKDAYRYGYRLWMDEESGLLLRSDVLNEVGKVVEQVMFTSINVNPEISDKDLESKVDSKGFRTIGPDEDESVELDTSEWAPLALPAGFSVISRRFRQIGPERVQVEHFVLSDGLSTVSVFIDANPKRKDMLQGLSGNGAVNAYGVYRDEGHVTVVGEVPAATVSLIGGD